MDMLRKLAAERVRARLGSGSNSPQSAIGTNNIRLATQYINCAAGSNIWMQS